jgi:PAS domain S-box-containing protein
MPEKPTYEELEQRIQELEIAESKSTKMVAALREKEAKYRLLVNSANEAILVAQDGFFVFANPKAQKLLDCSKDEIRVRPFMDFIHEDYKELVKSRHERRLKGEILPDKYTFKLIDKSKNAKWVELKVALFLWKGKPATLCFFTDITKQKQAEMELFESEEKFRVLFESSKDPNYISNIEGTIIDANQSFFNLFNYTKEDLHYLKMQDLYVNPNDRSIFLKAINKFGFVKDFEEKLRKKAGEEMDCQITATVRRSSNGDIHGYQGIIRDTTEIKLKQLEKERLIADLKKTLAEVKKLSGLLPICMHCKKIRDDSGYWKQIEDYLSKHSDAQFSHGICRECAEKYYPDLGIYDEDDIQG